MPNFIAENAKAITALIVSVLAWLSSRYALHLDPATEMSLATLLVALAVYLVPNRPPSKPGAPASKGDGTGEATPPRAPPAPPTHLRMFAVPALVLAGCALFTPARVAEVADIACVIAHFELPDSELAKVCGVTAEQVPAARKQAVRSQRAAMARGPIDAGVD